jgi:hypothetical protein
MVPVLSLWLPILVSAVGVFIVSALVHMVLPYHRTDVAQVPSQDAVQDALRPFSIPPGDYVLPHSGGPAGMKDPEFLERVKRGPVVFMTVRPAGMTGMGKQLAYWFIYCVVVSIFAAYLAGRALPVGAEYAEAFRFAGTVTFVGYALALWQNSIWYGRKWSTTVKDTIDGFVYALVAGGVFGWLWPGA